jgi:Prophage minor tail protein Z (GPZ)
MDELTFTVQGTEDLTRRLLNMGEDAPKAATRAINRALTSAKTLASRGLAAKLGVAQNVFARSLWTHRATWNDQEGAFVVGTARLKLVNLKASQVASDVAFRYKAGYRDIPEAAGAPFVATMPSGHTGIFVRSTRPPEHRGGQAGYRKSHRGSWLPIGEVYGPPLSRVFQRELLPATLAKAEETLVKELNGEINFITTGSRTPAVDE